MLMFSLTLGGVALRASSATPHPPHLVRRARVLAWVGLGWHFLEAVVAIGAGVVAGSVALIGFGADSLIEALAAAASCARRRGQRRRFGAGSLVLLQA
jgi:hypothetical protein